MAKIDLQLDPPYREDLAGILSFSSFEEAENTILSLEKLCRKYQSASDKKGVEYCRKIASLGRRRAELISRNKKVDAHKRLQKKEIAAWFKIWLETPAIFGDWLAMRKNTEEFQKLLELEQIGGKKAGDLYVTRKENP
ncbi:MAG: hypothetical protein JXA73_25395 [Acidobacteria bacterium]|nr:hypothetical protein [Acidobacteriota bacterium]